MVGAEEAGDGMYQRYADHEPNAEVAYPFNSHRCVVNALRPIEPGEQVLNSYIDQHDADRSRHSRRKMLRENYLFDCR